MSEDVTFLLLIPPLEAVCSVPGHSDELLEKPQFLKLPVQVFEMSKYYVTPNNIALIYHVYIMLMPQPYIAIS